MEAAKEGWPIARHAFGLAAPCDGWEAEVEVEVKPVARHAWQQVEVRPLRLQEALEAPPLVEGEVLPWGSVDCYDVVSCVT